MIDRQFIGDSVAPNRFDDCGGPHCLLPSHTVSAWESKPTTCAERAVIAYLTETKPRCRGKNLLHVGLGNGSLFKATRAELRSFVGITISEPELQEFRRRFGDASEARILLANKHDPRFFAAIGSEFDVIVDVNLKSYACCEKHFHETMSFFGHSLAEGGTLLTAQSGLEFGWAGNTAVAHTPGADASAYAQDRVLGVDGLQGLATKLGLRCRRLQIEPGGGCSAETLWILEKP